MAIFVALIFQVLFVAFAMAINIGLIVHDKINLQNSVDLAAYYGAQRQAEMLNVIAHENYQIRQAYKLLAWRYNVLGSAGRDDHPSKVAIGNASDTVYEEMPTMCLSYRPLFEEVGRGGSDQENACRTRDVRIPEIKMPGVIAGFNPINIIFNNQVRNFIGQLKNLCQDYGAFNFYMAAASMASFRRDQANRKMVIYALANNMSRPFEEMSDLQGAAVRTGMQKTFEKNLSYENFDSVEEFTTFNSLQGFKREDWLHELPIQFTLLYSDFTSGGGTSCASVTKMASTAPVKVDILGDELTQQLLNFVASPPPGDINQMSIGVEKNPWVMVYAGARAKSRPRQIFWPLGDPIQFEATAYAQPFGGRIGPWFFSNWANGARGSSGDKVDKLLPDLVGGTGASAGGAGNLLPNYSRFPGDKAGLKSYAAHASLPNVSTMAGKFSDYMNIADIGPGGVNDVLAAGGSIRVHEIAAIAPDLFDITYYSIEPKFSSFYLPQLEANRDKLGFGNMPLRGDLGGRNVADQVKTGSEVLNGTTIQGSSAYWYVRDSEQMLVDWVHNDSFEIFDGINQMRFGKCGTPDDGMVPAPGGCIAGGRTGYSVKLISPEYLMSTELPLGGPGQNGGILNPPPDGF